MGVRRASRPGAVLAAMAVLAACGGGGDAAPPAAPTPTPTARDDGRMLRVEAGPWSRGLRDACVMPTAYLVDQPDGRVLRLQQPSSCAQSPSDVAAAVWKTLPGRVDAIIVSGASGLTRVTADQLEAQAGPVEAAAAPRLLGPSTAESPGGCVPRDPESPFRACEDPSTVLGTDRAETILSRVCANDVPDLSVAHVEFVPLSDARGPNPETEVVVYLPEDPRTLARATGGGSPIQPMWTLSVSRGSAKASYQCFGEGRPGATTLSELLGG